MSTGVKPNFVVHLRVNDPSDPAKIAPPDNVLESMEGAWARLELPSGQHLVINLTEDDRQVNEETIKLMKLFQRFCYLSPDIEDAVRNIRAAQDSPYIAPNTYPKQRNMP